MIETKFWKPSLTSQFDVCPIPFRLDTYRGCIYNCRYCFARDFVLFSRRNSNMDFTDLIANNGNQLRKWINKTLNKEDDYRKGEEIAFKERLPIKIGATSDPFPIQEKEYKVTYSLLTALHEIDYPVEIQTKNPEILAYYSKDFKNPNWAIAVTLISTNEDFLKICEPNAPSCKRRLKAIEKLVKEGKNVMIKCQPSIYPVILSDLPDLVKQISNNGCWALNTEGLKIRITMNEKEQEQFKIISDFLGYDLRHTYIKEIKTTSDYELSKRKKLEYTKLAEELCNTHKIKYFTADNNMGTIGCGLECCGTEILRNYKIWGGSSRSLFFSETGKESEKLGNCFANFIRDKSGKKKNKTLNELVQHTNKSVKKKKFFNHLK